MSGSAGVCVICSYATVKRLHASGARHELLSASVFCISMAQSMPRYDRWRYLVCLAQVYVE